MPHKYTQTQANQGPNKVTGVGDAFEQGIDTFENNA